MCLVYECLNLATADSVRLHFLISWNCLFLSEFLISAQGMIFILIKRALRLVFRKAQLKYMLQVMFDYEEILLTHIQWDCILLI